MLVAVSHLRPQHLAGGRQAHGRLLVEHPVDAPYEPFGAATRIGHARDGRLGFGADGGIVAFDERLRTQVPRDVGIGRLRAQRARVDDLQDVAVHRLPGAPHLGTLKVGAVDPDADAAHVARIVDAVLRRSPRLHRGRFEEVPLDPSADRQPLRVFRRLADGQVAERTLLADDLAGVGDPGGGAQPGERHLHLERGDRPAGVAAHPLAADRHDRGRVDVHDLALADGNRHRLARQRRRVEHDDLLRGPGLEALRGEAARQVQAEHGHIRQVPLFGLRAAGGLDRQADVLSGHAARDLHGTGARIERELERAERERAVELCRGPDRRRRRRPQQRHPEARVLAHLDAVGAGVGLADGEADLFASVVDAAPLGRGSIPGQIGRQVEPAGLHVGAVEEDAHGEDPGGADEQGDAARDTARHGTEEPHAENCLTLA